jgi:hypothetical protein
MYNGYGFEQPDFSGVGSLAPMSSSLSLNLPTVKRGGMFGGKGQQIGEAISAALNGYLAAGGNPAGIAGLQQLHQQRMYQQEQAAREQEYQRERTDKNADWMAQYNYEITHPKPGAGSEFERVAEAGGYQPGSPQYIDLMRRKAEAMANPMVMTAYGPMPYSAVAGGALPTKPVGPLTPIEDGGPTPSASGGFPGPY